jgi:uncharacterized membrane protein YhiD involved in acid resistance
MDSLNELIALLTNVQDATNVFTAGDVLFTTLLSFVLSLLVGWVYKITHRGTSYTQSYVQTLVMMSMVVAVIMLVVGSNIALAFSLVGALSIIRFRNAVKETRDVGYLFFAMAVGMACGTRFYLLAIYSTLIISGLMWAMAKLNLFAKEIREQILKIRLPGDMPHETVFNNVFSRYLVRADLITMETVQAGMLTELVYGIELKRGASPQALMEEVRRLNDNNKVTLISAQHEVDL